MKLHKYRNYKQYKKLQSRKNKRQIDKVWATHDVLAAVADSVKTHIPGARFGICHGAKAGWEVKGLRERLGIDVIGTDISDTAGKFEGMITWDFHEVKDEWIGRVDFIYSNCLDHSYDPELCLGKWMSCLQPKGLCFIEWSSFHGPEHSTPDDPFGATEQEYHDLLSKFGRIQDKLVVPPPKDHRYPLERKIFVVGLLERR